MQARSRPAMRTLHGQPTERLPPANRVARAHLGDHRFVRRAQRPVPDGDHGLAGDEPRERDDAVAGRVHRRARRQRGGRPPVARQPRAWRWPEALRHPRRRPDRLKRRGPARIGASGGRRPDVGGSGRHRWERRGGDDQGDQNQAECGQQLAAGSGHAPTLSRRDLGRDPGAAICGSTGLAGGLGTVAADSTGGPLAAYPALSVSLRRGDFARPPPSRATSARALGAALGPDAARR